MTPVFLHGGLDEATNLTRLARELRHLLFDCGVPGGPQGHDHARLIPTAIHTLEDVKYTIETFTKVKDKLFAGEYKSEKIASWA